ncbi:hypothetical protein SEA_MAGIC8_96 [Mycobacterium phage Magic8]|uniref:Uncharacterized protein n=4 Tax=Pegunavirus oline TaxID=1986350 RepID=A0A3S9UEY4_9CAUD|nr:hypothetical protein SEA_BATTERYCK_95 [Mycobacterium phage BatteryCK]AZS08877.1 hypothetical protein SEA_MAG7_95 [Mycobacterium phage Mag7]AZS10996.1 hypothetical protein SEA_VERITAS_96 [Mycobacterium phage Veritas]QNJ59833.1 hypothetical protein SEA_MAGIC8_96 [Mycobacterium phage Magic8]
MSAPHTEVEVSAQLAIVSSLLATTCRGWTDISTVRADLRARKRELKRRLAEVKRNNQREKENTTMEDPNGADKAPKGVVADPSTPADLLAAAAEAEKAAAAFRRQAAEIARAAEEARRPKMPTVQTGVSVVVTFRRYTSGREYNYAAIGWRTGTSVRWAVTGTETRRFNWAGLLDFIGEANWHTLAEVTQTRTVLASGVEPPVAEVMGRYGEVLRTERPASPFVGDSRYGDEFDITAPGYPGF